MNATTMLNSGDNHENSVVMGEDHESEDYKGDYICKLMKIF